MNWDPRWSPYVPALGFGQQNMHPMGSASINDPEQLRIMRALGRGGILDTHEPANLGKKVRVAPPLAGPDDGEHEVLRLSAINVASPETIAIDFSTRIIIPASGASDHRLRFFARWGSGGGFHEVEVDARRGGQLIVSCTSLQATFRYTADEPSPTYECSASVAYGTNSSESAGLTLTTDLEVLAIGGRTTDIAIPPFATAAAWYSSADPFAFAVPQGVLEFRREAPLGTIQSQVAPTAETFAPIPGRADFVTVRNAGGNNLSYGVIFQIDL